MKAFAIPDGAPIKVRKTTLRKERHGKERHPAVSLAVEWWPLTNDALNMLHPELQDMVFYVPEGEAAQQKIEGLAQVKKHLRVPGIWPQKIEVAKFAGYTVTIEQGIDDSSDLELYECTLSKFEIDPKEGGGLCIRFSIASNQEITPELGGALWALEDKEIKLVRLAPPAMKQPEPAIDGSQKAFDDAHPLLKGTDTGDAGTGQDAGAKFAENEAKGLNKPAKAPVATKARARGKRKPAEAEA